MNFIEMESTQKLRGGYYTPLDLATFLARWVKKISPRKVLEPSCGDGVFFEAMDRVRGFKSSDVIGFEIDREEAEKAHQKARDLGFNKITIYPDDFLKWAIIHLNDNTKLDAIIGNPPFVRYQYLPESFQLRAASIFKALGLHFTKHTNAWVPFIIASISLLRPGGRLAMVVPSEIIHVMHAQSLRTYLVNECHRLLVIDPEELWFDDTLQGAVLLLAEKRRDASDAREGLSIYPVKSREFLKCDPETIFATAKTINDQTVSRKWTGAILDSETRDLFYEIATHSDVHVFDTVATVDVGIVTGANKFFLVSDSVVESHRLEKWAHPMFGRSEHCPGIIYDQNQHKTNISNGNPTNFLWFHENEHTLDSNAKSYIKLGENQKLHTRYKCSVRTPWYTVPSVYSTEIGMLKRSHETPRLILNRIGAYTTDTAYRIRTHIDAEKLVGCFINPLTALSAELESRHYGGGVLELVPSEIERLIIPLPKDISPDLKSLDHDIRTLPTEQVLSRQARIVLGVLGLSLAQQERILAGWRKLRDRRHRTTNDITDEDI